MKLKPFFINYISTAKRLHDICLANRTLILHQLSSDDNNFASHNLLPITSSSAIP